MYRTSQAARTNEWRKLWVPSYLRPKTKRNNAIIINEIEQDHDWEMQHEHYRGYIWKRTKEAGISPRMAPVIDELVKLRGQIKDSQDVELYYHIIKMIDKRLRELKK